MVVQSPKCSKKSYVSQFLRAISWHARRLSALSRGRPRKHIRIKSEDSEWFFSDRFVIKGSYIRRMFCVLVMRQSSSYQFSTFVIISSKESVIVLEKNFDPHPLKSSHEHALLLLDTKLILNVINYNEITYLTFERAFWFLRHGLMLCQTTFDWHVLKFSSSSYQFSAFVIIWSKDSIIVLEKNFDPHPWKRTEWHENIS